MSVSLFTSVVNTIVYPISWILERLYDAYWITYKSQIPKQYRCTDTGPEFEASLTLLGKILYKFQPWMVRCRKRKIVHQVVRPVKITKITDKYKFLDPTRSRQYFSLVHDNLLIVCVKELVHFGEIIGSVQHTKYPDGSFIEMKHADIAPINKWIENRKLTYFYTCDDCYFPTYSSIRFPENIGRTITLQNAGGSSELSEALSMYYMFLRFGAIDFIPEMEVDYMVKSNICDYIVTIANERIGVSVTRAIEYNTTKSTEDIHGESVFNKNVTEMFVQSLLYKKMLGMVHAKRTVTDSNSFRTSIIHIWCTNLDDASTIKKIYEKIVDNDIYGLFDNTYILCSVCTSNFIYTNESE